MPAAKFLPNDGPLRSLSNPHEQLIQSLESVISRFPPETSAWEGDIDHSFGGLYLGPTALAYLFLRVSKAQPDLKIASQSTRHWVEAYLAIPRPETSPEPLNCGILGEPLSFLAVSAALTHDLAHVHKFLTYLPTLLVKEGSDEWCYGRSGLLYLLRLIKTWVPASADLINPAIEQTITTLLSNGPPFTFYKKRAWGTGHGELGIITQIILSSPAHATNSKVTAMLSDLLDLQLPSGTWPHSAEAPERLHVQFCHGAPGFAISLVSIRPYVSDSALLARMDAAVQKARAITWTEGLLTKEPNMCHGTTGNAFAFPPGEKRDHFLAYCVRDEVESLLKDGVYEECDYGCKHSLGFGGVPGLAWGLFARENVSDVFITYNDL